MGRAQDWYGSPSIRLARLLRRVWLAHFISENEVCMTTYLIHDCFLRKSEVGVGERDDLMGVVGVVGSGVVVRSVRRG